MSRCLALLALVFVNGCLLGPTARTDDPVKRTFASGSSSAAKGRTRSFRDYYQEPPGEKIVAEAQQSAATAHPRRPACPTGIHYEPLYRVGPLFLARVLQIPGCPITLPYTKNKTILACTLGGFMAGMLFGFVLAWAMMKGRSRHHERDTRSTPPPESESETESPKACPPSSPTRQQSQTFKSPTTVRKRMAALNLDASGEKKRESSSEESCSEEQPDFENQSPHDVPQDDAAMHNGEETKAVEADGAAQLVTNEMPVGPAEDEHMIKEYRALRESLQELTVVLQNIQKPLVVVVHVIKSIASEVNILRRLGLWMVGRQAKADAWQQATDSMYYGLFVMNMSLVISAFLFGRWQDWGQRCDAAYLSWDFYIGLRLIWCVIEEPVYFAMGCGMWCLLTMVAFSSRLMQRRDPISSFLLVMILSFCGVVHSWSVALLGGSWQITFSVWSLYALFLIHVMETAKDAVLKEALKSEKSLETPAVVRGLTSWESMHTAVAGFLFPVMAGALPFWNAGLSLVITSSIDRMLLSYTDSFKALYDRVAEFLLY